MMSKEAFHLINAMIQIEPKNRLGHDLESLKLLKTHPFFDGIDFDEVSKKDYKALFEKVASIMPKENPNAGADPRFSTTNVAGMESNPLADENKLMIKGNLCKKNWYGNKQIRCFELYKYGEIKYFKDMKDYKGSININAQTKVVKVAKTTIKIFCSKKQKEYTILQPDSS
jgi:hypothetical protein